MSQTPSVPLTPERQSLVVKVSGTVAAIALTLASEIGDERWFEDLRSAGYIGASEAAQRYDFASDTPFEGFAWSRIAGAMIDFLRRERLRLPPSLAAQLDKASAAAELAAEYTAQVRDKGSDETEEEADGVAAVVGVGLLCMGSAPLDPEKHLLRKEQLTHLDRAIGLLSERDRAMVTLRYFDGLRMHAIAQHFGIHEDSARKRLKDAMRRLGARLRPVFLIPEMA